MSQPRGIMGTMLTTTGAENPAKTDLGSFIANLPELLGAMATDGRTLVAIAEFDDGRYLQFHAEGEVVIAEVLSNLNVPNGDALTGEQEAMLEEAGWNIPIPVIDPNWNRSAGIGPGLLALSRASADAALRTLAKGLEPGTTAISLRTFELASGPKARQQKRCYVTEETGRG
jgi:hypothetical protein